MKSFLLNLLFPKRCVGCRKFGSYICANCFATFEFFTQLVCPVCIKPSIDGATHPKCVTKSSLDGFLAGVVYKRIVKKLVYSWKYQPFVSDLTNSISALLYEALIQQEIWHSIVGKNTIVVCVPLSSKKLRYRGYNHAELLAQTLSQKAGLVFVKNVLIRNKDTKAQFRLGKKEREENVKNVFSLNPIFEKKLMGKTVILVDDVATTFATLLSCAKVLKHAGAKKVWGITFTREG